MKENECFHLQNVFDFKSIECAYSSRSVEYYHADLEKLELCLRLVY